MSDTYRLLVVGGGPAGLAAARAYRAAGGAGPVAIVTDEHRVPYRRPPLTKQLLRGEMDEHELPIESESWLREHRVELIGGRAVSLEPHAHTVTLSGGRELSYRQAVLASGGEPTRLPLPGADQPGVVVLRTLDHLREILTRLDRGSAVVVIGSGFIGCEIAASLRRRGHPVTQISDEPAPNATRLGAEAAERIRGWLEEEGVALQLGNEVERIDAHDSGFNVVAGTASAAGKLVVMAGGVRPRLELALDAGLAIEGGAIRTDSAMRTSAEHLYAAGDATYAMNAVAGRRLRVEHWGDALGQGEVAGRRAAGEAAEWDAVPGFFSTIGAHTLKYAAWGDGFDAVRLEEHGDGAFTVWYGRDGVIVGALAHERDEDYEQAQALIAQAAPWR